MRLSSPSPLLIFVAALLTLLQIGGSGILVYQMVNDYLAGLGTVNSAVIFMVAVIIGVDLYLIYWLLRLADLLADAEEK